MPPAFIFVGLPLLALAALVATCNPWPWQLLGRWARRLTLGKRGEYPTEGDR